MCPEVTGRLPSLGPQSRGCSLGRRSCPHCQWRPPGMVSGLSAALSWWPKQMPGVASREILHRKEESRVPRGADLGGGGLLGGDRWATGSGGWGGAPVQSPDPALSPLCLRPGVLLEQRLLFLVASGGLPAGSFSSTGLSSQECSDRTGSSGHPGGPGATRGEGARQEPARTLGAWAWGPWFTPGRCALPRLAGRPRPGRCLRAWGIVWTPSSVQCD